MAATADSAAGYETDLVRWAEEQAALLRRRAAGELVNEAELDWTNIAEEIESLGRSPSDSGARKAGANVYSRSFALSMMRVTIP